MVQIRPGPPLSFIVAHLVTTAFPSAQDGVTTSPASPDKVRPPSHFFSKQKWPPLGGGRIVTPTSHFSEMGGPPTPLIQNEN